MVSRRSRGRRARGRGAQAFVLLLTLVLVAVGAGSATAQGTLADRIDDLAGRKPLRGADLGVLVMRARDGAVLYARKPDTPLVPASNMKILTALAALQRFGPAYTFETRFISPSSPGPDGAVGGLTIVGSGDPVLNSEDWWRIAEALATAGLRRVRGDLVVDDSLFDDVLWHPSWGRVTSRAYYAPIGALSANYASYQVLVRPGTPEAGGVHVDVVPPVPYLRVENRVATGADSTRRRLVVDRRVPTPAEREAPHEIVIVDGIVNADDTSDSFWRSVTDPGFYAASILQYHLEARGIPVDGVLRRGRAPAEGGHELLAFEGRKLSDIVGLFMKWSNNSIAETLVKAIGASRGGQGAGAGLRKGGYGWPDGLDAIRAELEAAGLDLAGAVLDDGSGLSARNRLSPRHLVAALRHARESFTIGPEFVVSLPIANVDGTLRDRGDGIEGAIRAKTGQLQDARVVALSGYARRLDGEDVVFSILVNRYRGPIDGAKRLVDGMATAIVSAPWKAPASREGGGR